MKAICVKCIEEMTGKPFVHFGKPAINFKCWGCGHLVVLELISEVIDLPTEKEQA